MNIKDSVALVTGANRGFGLALTKALLERGARKVYAAARDVSTLKLVGVVPVELDVTNPDQVVGLHIGFMATDMTSGIDIPKDDPIAPASAALAGIEAGQDEVLADDAVRRFKRGLSVEPGIYLSRASA